MKGKSNKAYRTFNGKKYTLMRSGTKGEIQKYISSYGIPQNALYRTVKAAKEHRLYMFFKKKQTLKK